MKEFKTAMLIILPLAVFMFVYSHYTDKLVENCKPNFEKHICE